MRNLTLGLCVVLLLLASGAIGTAYVEAPHTLGLVCKDSSNIVLMEVVRVNKEKGLIIFKKLQDLKGKEQQSEIKHNIGQRGFHPREWQNVMNWAEPGKKAVFFHNGGASETCIGNYWYQCYREGEWWGMSHAEPFLLRTYCGDCDKLAAAVTQILQGREAVVPCFADGSKDQLHQRKGKLQRLRASLRLLDYNPRRDFVGWGGDGDEIEEFKTVSLIAESSDGWRFLPAAAVRAAGDRWRQPEYEDAGWREGKTPIGYGEPEIGNRKGTSLAERGQDCYFRRVFDLPSELLAQKGVVFRLAIASDDNAVVYLNGHVVDQDPEADHEFAYWNRDIELQSRQLRPGRNVLAIHVKNKSGSSDLYLDVELSAQVPLPRAPKKNTAVAAVGTNQPRSTPAALLKSPEPPGPLARLTVNAQKGEVIIPCKVAPRKLPNLQEVYPIEVVATYPVGQKAHETVLVFTGIRPSDVHRALEQLGLKPGKPARGEGETAQGPEVRILLEITGPGGKRERRPIDSCLVDRKSGQPLPPVRWHFTGSNVRQPDPEKDEHLYGADVTGTLLALFPVTDDTVIQSSLTLKEEAQLKLEIARDVLPVVGTAVNLVIECKRELPR